MEYQIVLDSFEGPLDLLYQLVKENEIDISEISLAKITDQYLSYINQMQKFDIDLAGEFLIIAAELIEIKIKANGNIRLLVIIRSRASIPDSGSTGQKIHTICIG